MNLLWVGHLYKCLVMPTQNTKALIVLRISKFVQGSLYILNKRYGNILNISQLSLMCSMEFMKRLSPYIDI